MKIRKVKKGNNMEKAIDQLALMTAKGFKDISERMATKKDLENFVTKDDLNDLSREVIRGFENVKEDLINLEEISIRNLEHKVFNVEKDLKILKRKHG